MTNTDTDAQLAHQSKKKRSDDETPAIDTQKPLQLQRRRVWRACECCRRKKIKCDGVEPNCSQCVASGSQCTWLQTKDRAALSRHYVQELEARLLHMEGLFNQITPVLEQLGPAGVNALNLAAQASTSNNKGAVSTASATAVLQALASPQPTTSNAGTSALAPIKVEDDDVSEKFGQLALDEHGHMRWMGGSSTMSLIQSFRALTSGAPLHRISPMEEDPRAPGPSVNKLYFPASVFFGKISALPGPEEAEFPPRDLSDKLVQAYFTRFHFLMPVLDKPSFLRNYQLLMDGIHDPSIRVSEAPFMALLFAVYACAACMVDDPRLVTGNYEDGGMGMVYYERSLMLQYISHSHTQVMHVQCFTILTSFLCSVNCLPQAWILVGQAVRIGQDLGLHRSPRRLTIGAIEKETRRKIWWGVYQLDRMLALALGRPLGIEDTDCDVEYPVDVDDERLPEFFRGDNMSQGRPSVMGGFIALSTLYKIAGRVLRDVYALDVCKDHLEPEKKERLQQRVEALDDDLTRWCDQLPNSFKTEPTNEEHVAMGAVLCSHYYSVLTTLHRNFLPVKREFTIPTPKSTSKAVSSARSCIRLAETIQPVVPPSHHLAFFIQNLFSSSVILLLYAMHAVDATAAKTAFDEANNSLVFLESCDGRWPGARKCKELLMELSNTAKDAMEGVIPAPTPTHSQAPMSPTTPLERRRSVSIATVPTVAGSSSQRVVKGRRRPQSRDPNPAARRAAAASPYRVDSAQRARSASRKRGHDEPENPGPSLQYQVNTFHNPGTGATTGAGTSSRSDQASSSGSPASVNLPSPTMSALEPPQQQSSNMTSSAAGGSQASAAYANYGGVSPVSPTLVPSSPTRYEYGYSMSQQQQQQTAYAQPQQQWNGHSHQAESHQERGGVDIFSAPYSPAGTYGSAPESSYLGHYGPVTDMTGYATFSTTPPTSTFDATGLPFRGLDYIRNYNPGGFSSAGQEAEWSTYDPGAFGYEPEIPFTLSDYTLDPHRNG